MKVVAFLILSFLFSFTLHADEESCLGLSQSGRTHFAEANDSATKADFFYDHYVTAVKNHDPESEKCSNADLARKGYWRAAKLYLDSYYEFDHASTGCNPYGEEVKIGRKAADSAADMKSLFEKTYANFTKLDEKMTTRCSLTSLPALSL